MINNSILNQYNKRFLLIMFVVMIFLTLLAGCGIQGTSTSKSPVQSPSATLAISATGQPATPVPPEGPTAVVPAQIATLAEIMPTRTAEPTSTPDSIGEAVDEIVQETGLSGQTFVGLGVESWINLIISLLFVLAGYLVGTVLIRGVFPNLVSRTKTPIDDELLKASGNELRWLFVVIILRLGTKRLDFLSADSKRTLLDVYFILTLFLVITILWRLINLAARQADERAIKAGRQKQVESLIVLLVWGLRIFVIIFSISVLLIHFGVNITGFAVLLGVIGLALSLGARDVLADIISGTFILLDHPYRIGDRIELTSLNTWGDVVDIGMRSTRVVTLNNRMVVVPNSQIGKNQVVNYTYPDPSYYDMSNFMVAYDNNADQVAQLLVETIRSVEGVEKERDIDALLMELSEYQMVFWTGWWIASYKDRYYVHDRVNRAVMRALKENGVNLPYMKGHMKIDSHGALDHKESDKGDAGGAQAAGG